MENSSIIFNCDNFSIVHAFNKKTPECPHMMLIIRPMILLLLEYNINFKRFHIYGKK